MRKLTDGEEDTFAFLAVKDPDAADRMANAWRSMSDVGRARFARLSECVAALLKELDLTVQRLQYIYLRLMLNEAPVD